MSKNLDYYMSLPYRIEIIPLTEEDGGGYVAMIPRLGRYAFAGDGDTIEEAIRHLRRIMEERFSEYLERGVDIPEPEQVQNEYKGE